LLARIVVNGKGKFVLEKPTGREKIGNTGEGGVARRKSAG